MQKFYFKANRPNNFFLFLWPILAIAKGISWYYDRSNLDLLIAIFFAIAAIFGFLGFRRNVNAFLLIDENGIEWLNEKMHQPIRIPWQEIERIKFENEGISIFQASSFREFILIKNLKSEDQVSVKELLSRYVKDV